MDRVRQTGYAQALRGLYGEGDLNADSVPRIAEKYRETDQPALLAQDLSILEFCRCSVVDVARVEPETDKQPGFLDGWLNIIDF
ncbi:hypothetical protein [Bradyrhizobium sp. WSM1743]|uniref:hypothetical protein n=1 Tax=Bradyrhizobium sp. WSM1743 TaxID=318996 RepID=UPI0004877AB5|nr:hypothetical protein [Bradyrhizobium sp. WSM1743]